MQARELVESMAAGARVRDMSSGRNQVYRIFEEGGQVTVVKVYSNPGRERREYRALSSLAGVAGVPQIVERGTTEDLHWLRLSDTGAWDLATLSGNLDATRKAGAVLRGVHSSDVQLTNLEQQIDTAYVADHYRSTLDRLERYRRKAELPREVLDAAREAAPPVCSAPVPSHTRPAPSNFMVSENGDVTLVDWEWATPAPPEWDVSFATWHVRRRLGPEAAAIFLEGYGGTFPEHLLRRWIAYHAASSLLEAAEVREGRLGDLQYLVEDLAG
jgi:aminoglycoside phosphotransferase (APT) family kinase protein